MNATEIQRYKRLLLAKRDELSTTQADPSLLARRVVESMGDFADQANADTDANLHIRLHQSDAHLQRAIEDALARITQDLFGVCETCGSPISKARLEAVPWTGVCRDCKEREQSAA